MSAMKSRLEAEITSLNDELDELRRKTNKIIIELQDELNRERSRANNLEKMKNKLLIEIEELTLLIDELRNKNADLQQQLDDALRANDDLRDQLANMKLKLDQLAADNDRLKGENERLKNELDALKAKNALLEKENNSLKGDLKDALGALAEAKDQLGKLQAENMRLQGHCDQLKQALKECEDALKAAEDALARSGADAAIRIKDLEDKLAAKEAELEALKKSLNDRIDELTMLISEMEAKHKADLSRLRRKYETIIAELQAQLDALKRANLNLVKENKSLIAHLKDLEATLLLEREGHEEAVLALQTSEKKRIQLQADLDELQMIHDKLNSLYKALQEQAEDITAKNSQISLSLKTANNEKRNLEGQLGTTQSSLDAAHVARDDAEERAVHLSKDLSRCMEELNGERQNNAQTGAMKSKLEIELHEANNHVESLKSSHSRDQQRTLQQANTKIHELESQLDAEHRRALDASSKGRKFERMYRDALTATENNQRQINELQASLNKAEMRLKSLRRQLDDHDTLKLSIMTSPVKASTENLTNDVAVRFVRSTETPMRSTLYKRATSIL